MSLAAMTFTRITPINVRPLADLAALEIRQCDETLRNIGPFAPDVHLARTREATLQDRTAAVRFFSGPNPAAPITSGDFGRCHG